MNSTTKTENSLVTGEFGILRETQAIRNQIMEVLTDADLAYRFPNCPSLGELCREVGETEQAYIESYKTFKQVFDYGKSDPALATSVARLKTWYTQLDHDLEAAMAALSEDDVQHRVIERGFPMPPGVQFHCYREALLIFYGRAVLYLRALGKPLPEQTQRVDWVTTGFVGASLSGRPYGEVAFTAQGVGVCWDRRGPGRAGRRQGEHGRGRVEVRAGRCRS